MADTIFIKNLLIRGIIGINPDERVNKQDILINIEMQADTSPAAQSDDIVHAVNYRTITKKVIKLVEDTSYFLVEKLVQEIANVCLENQQVAKVRVTVEKPGAIRFAESVGITIERTRDAA